MTVTIFQMRRRLIATVGAAGLASVFNDANAETYPDEAAFKTMAAGLVLPEGPIALDNGDVLVVEIGRGVLSRVSPDGSIKPVAVLDGGPNGAAIGPDGACYIANNGGSTSELRDSQRIAQPGFPPSYKGGSIQRVNLKTGEVQTLYTGCDGELLRGPNDLVFDEWGGFWFTDFGKMTWRQLDLGAVYWALPDGSQIRKIIFPLVRPNGIALSPDRKTLYVALAMERQILAYTITGPGQLAMDGAVPKKRIVVSLGGNVAFDSMAVEESGNLVIGTLFEAGLTVISPAGEMLYKVPLPEWTTNIAFGGVDRKTVFVTMTRIGKLLTAPWPRPGLKLLYR